MFSTKDPNTTLRKNRVLASHFPFQVTLQSFHHESITYGAGVKTDTAGGRSGEPGGSRPQCGQLISHRDTRRSQWGGDHLFSSAGNTGWATCRRMTRPVVQHTQKLTGNGWEIKCKTWNYKTPRRKQEKAPWRKIGSDFWDMIPKSRRTKVKISW